MMISSYAVRAFETAYIIADIIGYPRDNIQISGNLYHAGSGDILDELFSQDDSINSIMIFGHNPTFTSFANQFADEAIDWLPTTAVVAIRFDTDKWTEIPICRASTEFVVYPKHL